MLQVEHEQRVSRNRASITYEFYKVGKVYKSGIIFFFFFVDCFNGFICYFFKHKYFELCIFLFFILKINNKLVIDW